MAEILITGMEMPKACFKGAFDHCPFYATCEALKNFCNEHSNEDIINKIYQCRMDDCPLVALPEHHGRLIDADFFKEYAVRVHTEEGKEYIPADYIDIVPTIVEASNGHTD